MQCKVVSFQWSLPSSPDFYQLGPQLQTLIPPARHPINCQSTSQQGKVAFPPAIYHVPRVLSSSRMRWGSRDGAGHARICRPWVTAGSAAQCGADSPRKAHVCLFHRDSSGLYQNTTASYTNSSSFSDVKDQHGNSGNSSDKNAHFISWYLCDWIFLQD